MARRRLKPGRPAAHDIIPALTSPVSQCTAEACRSAAAEFRACCETATGCYSCEETAKKYLEALRQSAPAEPLPVGGGANLPLS